MRLFNVKPDMTFTGRLCCVCVCVCVCIYIYIYIDYYSQVSHRGGLG